MDEAELKRIMQGRGIARTSCVPGHVAPGNLKAGRSRTTGGTSLCFSLDRSSRGHRSEDYLSPFFRGRLELIWYLHIPKLVQRQRVTSQDIKRTSLSPFVLLTSCLHRENAKLTHFFQPERAGRLSRCSYITQGE